MNYIALILLPILFFHIDTIQVGDITEDGTIPEYDIKCAGTGIEGTYLTEVSIYLPKPDKEINNNLCKAAVHGVMFQGISPSSNCNGQRAIIPNPEIEKEHSEFFVTFFSTPKEYSRFANIVAGSLRVTKTEKKRYRITAVISIKKDALRKMLEQKNIIDNFEDLF